MSSHRTTVFALFAALFATGMLAACGPEEAAPPDAAAPPSTIPTSPAGGFAITSSFDLRVPPAAGPVIAGLAAATDGPDDPMRYLVDCMIDTLPDGPVKLFAEQAAPYVAAYLNLRLAEIAPRFATGVHAISDGLARIAGHLGTTETLQIDATGAAIRTVTAVRFELGAAPMPAAVIVRFADVGLADIATRTKVTLDPAGRIAIGQHAHPLPYGALLRLGLERAVVPGVVPGARDLAGALAALVDCARLGELAADGIGIGSPTLYRSACQAGMTAVAAHLIADLTAIDASALGLDLTGTATGVDVDGDGTMDELRAGLWSGALTAAAARTPISAASFTGRER